jgi:hypothetical protein
MFKPFAPDAKGAAKSGIAHEGTETGQAPAQIAASASEVAALKAQLEQMQQRLDRLVSGQDVRPDSAVTNASSGNDTTD